MSTPSKTGAPYLWPGILVLGLLPLVLYWPAFNQSVALESLPLQTVGPLEQWLVVITAFGVKPAYMLLSLVWIVWLWRRQAADLVALRWGLIWFLGGETACAVNYIFFGGLSSFTDYLHSFGMAVGFSFVAYAALDGVDARLIKYSAAKDRCAALSLCRACIKYATGSAGALAGDVQAQPGRFDQAKNSPARAQALPVCGLRRLFMLLIPALIVVAFMLPCADLKTAAHRTCIFNSVQAYSDPLWSQLFEGRYCAWLAIGLLLASWAALLFKRQDPVAMAKVFFAAALGPLGFGLMRLFLRTAYADDLVWSNIWEELTELLFAVGVGFVLWTFQPSLFRDESAASPREPETPPPS
jgi:hypothetical protein